MQRPHHRLGFTLVELMIVVAIIGILAQLAITNLLRMQARSQRSEARANLRALFVRERSYYADKERYTTLASQLGFNPDRGNRYGYSLSGAAAAATNCEDRSAALAVAGSGGTSAIGPDRFRFRSAAQFEEPTPSAPGVVTWSTLSPGTVLPTSAAGGLFGSCPDTCSFTASAKANLDQDAAIDYQSVSSESQTVAAGRCNPAQASVAPGDSATLFDDVQCSAN
jgi:prepilin-type N-terminal cleavage/methylation domain-containing protein